MPIRSLGYVRWETPNVEQWRRFGETLGLMAVDGPEPGSVAFRWDERPYRLVVAEAASPRLGGVGYEVADDIELDELVAEVTALGCRVERQPEAVTAGRQVTGLACFEDPAGIPTELFHGPVLTHELVVSPFVSGFRTGPSGLGHVVLAVDDVAATARFYRAIGFRLRNTYRRGPMYMEFLGCNPRHHTLALAEGLSVPTRLIHIMVEAATLDDVGLARDRCVDAGIPIVMDLGRHTNDHMVSFYCATPDGAMVEFGWGGDLIDHDTNQETSYAITKASVWGHRRPAAVTDAPPPRDT